MTDPSGADLRSRRTRPELTQREVAARPGVAHPLIPAAETARRGIGPDGRAELDAALQARPSTVLERHRSAVREVVARHHGRDAFVIGSVARGDDTPGSDLDLMVTFDDGTDLVDVLDLTDELEELLGTKVDVISGRVAGAAGEHARRDAAPL